jgi:hypothetical protein
MPAGLETGLRGSSLPFCMRRLSILALVLMALCIRGLAADGKAMGGAVPAAPGPILPHEFGGWQLAGQAQISTDPGVADPVNAQALREYGFKDFEAATYSRDDGRKLKIRAARFVDASGAYGAFTFYKQPEMLNEKIGSQASSLNNRVLFYTGNVLVDAVFDRLSAMSAAELRELASDIPTVRGAGANLPGLPTYLPKPLYVKNTAKYVLGPAALDHVGAPVPSQLVDFNAGAEVVLGNFNSSGGQGDLMLISYPTPQIAGEHLRRIEAARQANQQQQPGALPFAEVGTFLAKRTGPIVVIAAGPYSSDEAKELLAAVNYDADVTWNENTLLDKKNNLANLLVNIIILCGILIGIGLVAGIAFGGLRVLLRRWLPGKEDDERVEFISLHLD